MKKSLFIGFFLLTSILIGCSGESAANDMYDHLEETVKLEQTFVEQQEPFSQLEEKEQEIYNQIIELSADEMEEINSLAEEAIKTIEDRKEILEKELTSMQEAKEEFTKVKDYVSDLDEEPKAKAEELIQTMEERYQVYNELNEAYKNSLKEDQKLYELFMDEELTEETLRNQIDAVNSSYDKVMEKNERFNELTDTYNQQKEQFYKAADLNVVYE